MLTSGAAQNSPRIPSAALELCQHSRPLPAAEVIPSGASTKLLHCEVTHTTVGSSSAQVGIATAGEAAACVAVLSRQSAKLLIEDAHTVKHLSSHLPTFGLMQGHLPSELRIFAPAGATLSEAEKRALYRIKAHKKPQIQKPLRRGGAVVSSSTTATTPKPVSGKVSSKGGSGLVDVAAAEAADDVTGERKRKRDPEDDAGSDGAADDADENSVSSVSSVDDDDEGVDDVSDGRGSDDLMF